MHVLIPCIGSYGDVLPYLNIAISLKNNGHTCVIYANEHFKALIESAGLKFRKVGNEHQYQSIFSNYSESSPISALDDIAKHYAITSEDYFRTMRMDIVPGCTIVFSSVLLFASRLLKELEGIPFIGAHVSPCTIRSSDEPSRLGERWITPTSPSWIKRLTWRISDLFVYDRLFTNPFNKLRKKYGLSPIHQPFMNWINHADVMVALFPEWFAPIQADWPSNLITTEFPILGEPEAVQLVPDDIGRFLNTPGQTVMFTPGTANGNAKKFFETSIEACAKLNVKALLTSAFSEHIPDSLPSNVRYCKYISFDYAFSRIDAVVHHGGIGTTAQALRHGLPQLIRPTAFDQFDNSLRTSRLGCSIEILPSNYTTSNLSIALERLLTSESVKSKASVYKQYFNSTNSMTKLMEVLNSQIQK